MEAIGAIQTDPRGDLQVYYLRRGWPADAEFAEALVRFGLYKREPEKGRLLLERLEDSYGHKERVVRALFALGHVPHGGRLLDAMLAESARAAAVCGDRGMPERYTPAQWGAAVDAAGGFAAAGRRLRAARQAARTTAWSGQDPDRVAFTCSAELDDVIRRLSGRLV